MGVEKADGSGEIDEARTKRLFAALTKKIERTRFPFADNIGHINPHIPAGYTYLAQFIAHDLTINSGLDEGLEPDTKPINLRSHPLHLDCLYGYGPSIEPACYELFTRRPLPQRIGWPRTRFRLDGMSDDNFMRPADPARHPRRDIGRLVEPRGANTAGIALIADLRNDDNAVISQLTALLQLAHNTAMDKLEGGKDPATPEASFRNFSKVRSALTCVYRQIISQDLLPRLLNGEVVAHYEANDSPFFDTRDGDDFVTPEFAHAAYRAGHAMVRESYFFNSEPPVEHNLMDVLRRNSERNPPKTPHNRDWIIAWSYFFDLGIREARASGRLEPRFETPLHDDTLFPAMEENEPAGLAYRDLVRSATTSVRKIDTLAEQIAYRQPELAAASPWINSPAIRQEAMRRWIEADTTVDLGELKEEAISNPPPMVYFLVEAAAAEDGFRLGPLGSVVLAETFYRALSHRRSVPFDEREPREDAEKIFGMPTPASMPDLIRWVDENMSLEDKTFLEADIPLI
ncbi:hypothetical protein GR183_12800 [Stappia sp. GBMRC 2046]|uniref:Animal haem peroxidase n=1 Tax=Stappia sediminis TaxID=2692190 RepID=A0A7X3LVC7_9HYPH|nr:peroxidase family protein [Stappia sediminis]MXN65787.1 hypothetical protein [Stappia sediminis]